MSFKRARAECQGGTHLLPTNFGGHPDDQVRLQEGAKKFRHMLLEKYTEGSYSASDVCLFAYWHTEAGGLGTEDLALHPKTASRHGSEHLRPEPT